MYIISLYNAFVAYLLFVIFRINLIEYPLMLAPVNQ